MVAPAPPVRRLAVAPMAGPWTPPADAERVATLAEAMARAANCAGPVEIVLAPGDHVVRAPIVVPARSAPTTLRGAGPGARLVGGALLAAPSWGPAPAPLAARLPAAARAAVRHLRLPPAALAGWTGGLSGPLHQGHGVPAPAIRSELFVGGAPQRLARWPDDGFAPIARLVDAGSAPRLADPDIPAAERVVEPPRGGAFVVGDAARAARWAGVVGAWAHGYWNWDWSDELLPIAAVDAATATVRLAQPHRYGLAARGRFCIVNLPEELDAVGEHWIDPATGDVLALLADGGEALPAAVSLLAAPMLQLDGARDVRIEALAFFCSRSAAIRGDGARDVAVVGCSFHGVGSPAIGLRGADCRVQDCRFTDTAGVGVDLEGGDRATLTPGGMVVEDCVFARCSRVLRTYHPAIRVAGVGGVVRRNDVGDLPHFALMLYGNDHLVEANEFHHVVRETGDAGALYLGRDWTAQGLVVRGNLFHAIAGSDGRFQNGVYLDDMASGALVERNLFVQCNWGVLAGGGRDVVVRDNAFVGCGLSVRFDARGVGWMAPHLADPATSTLRQRFAAMPVAAAPWTTRYPALAAYESDRLGRPVGSSVEGSVLLASRPPRIDDRELVAERGAVELPAPADLVDACQRLVAAARAGDVEVGGVPIGPVGPRRLTP